MHFIVTELFSGNERHVKVIWEVLALLPAGCTALHP